MLGHPGKETTRQASVSKSTDKKSDIPGERISSKSAL
jgi:hypothetical protein